MYRKNGSLSLYLCLILSAMLAVGSVLAAAAWLRAAELDLARALDSQVQTGLAAYDRELFEQFGLLGVSHAKIDQTVFAASLYPPLSELPLHITAMNDLFSPPELEKQIVTHMQGRLPFVYLENLTRFIGSWNTPADSGDSFFSQTSSILSRLPVNETERISRGLFGGVLDELQEDAAIWLSNIYRRYASELAGVSAEGSLAGLFDFVPDFFNPSDMAAAAGKFDELLSIPVSPIYEKMCLVEYIMGYFTAEVRVIRQGGTGKSLLTIDGRPISDFPTARRAEIEQILIGINNPASAATAFRFILISLRSVIHLGSIILDETQMATFRSAAIAICASVAALTSGAVVVEPEVMTWLLAAGKALIDGWGDYNRLRQGYTVALWPSESGLNIDLHYIDYLRLFLYTQPRQVLLDRSAKRLRDVVPGNFATRIEASVDFGGNSYAVSGAYP